MARVEIILLEARSGLGMVGDVVKVRAGYARNFLLPQGKALRSTERNRKVYDERRDDLLRMNTDKESRANMLLDAMKDLRLVVPRQAGISGQLYGSVSVRDIAEALTGEGHPIDHHSVRLAKPIKTLGAYSVVLELSPTIVHTIHVDVVNSNLETDIFADEDRELTDAEAALLAEAMAESEKSATDDSEKTSDEVAEATESGEETPAEVTEPIKSGEETPDEVAEATKSGEENT